MKLAYINELGPNYKGDNIYEFIFSDIQATQKDTFQNISVADSSFCFYLLNLRRNVQRKPPY